MRGKQPDPIGQEAGDPSPQPGTADGRMHDEHHRRGAPRFPLPVRAVVEIPGLPPRDYGVCEISRSGMFLAFLNAQETRPEFERSETGQGAEIAISFEVMLPDVCYHCELPARVVRTTHSGIGVQVSAPNQAQLDELIAHLPPVRAPVGGDSA